MSEHNLAELMNRFMETSNITINPKNTRIQRLIILRFLYSFGKMLSVNECVIHLEKYGVQIGKFDHVCIEVAQNRNLTKMYVPEWLVLICAVSVEDFDQIFFDIREQYHTNTNSSPILNIYNTLEQNMIPKEIIGQLCLRIFLGVFNCEIDRVEIVSKILQFSNFTESVSIDLTLRILGPMNTSMANTDIMNDICTVLRAISISETTVCQTIYDFSHADNMKNSTKVRDKNQSSRRESLSAILSTVREQAQISRMHQDKNNNGIQNIPPDMPIDPISWSKKSTNEQKIILLIVCIKKEFIESRSHLIYSLYGNIVQKSIDSYIIKENRIEAVISNTISLLVKINKSIDISDEKLPVLMKKFTEECFTGIFGEKQQSVMTLPFIVQLYLISFLESTIQARFYQHTISNFNRRLQIHNKELSISEYIPINFLKVTSLYCKSNKFDMHVFTSIFKTLTV